MSLGIAKTLLISMLELTNRQLKDRGINCVYTITSLNATCIKIVRSTDKFEFEVQIIGCKNDS